jgi:hypothetical protein
MSKFRCNLMSSKTLNYVLPVSSFSFSRTYFNNYDKKINNNHLKRTYHNDTEVNDPLFKPMTMEYAYGKKTKPILRLANSYLVDLTEPLNFTYSLNFYSLLANMNLYITKIGLCMTIAAFIPL